MNILSSLRRRRAALALVSACVSLEASAQHALEEIVVTGTPRDRSAAEMAQPVTVLSGEALNRSRSTNLGETLEGQLGVSASYFGTGASRPIIRGLAGARVRLMEDGIESMDVSTVSADHAVGIDPLVARQIEIFRGPTTLLYGSGAVGGVINTVTNRIPETAPDDGFDAALEVRGDTAADERTGAFAVDAGGDEFAWHLDAARRLTDDYEIPGFAAADHPAGHTGEAAGDQVEGVLENSDLEPTSYAFGGTKLGPTGTFGLSFSGFETQYGVPGHVHGVNGEEHEEAVRIDLEQTRVDLKGSWTVLRRIEAVNLRLGFGDYEHVELRQGVEIGTRFLNDAREGRVELLHAPIGKWSGAFGLQFGAREFAAIGEEAFVPPVDTVNYGLFWIEHRQRRQWNLSFGARYDVQEHDPTGRPAADGNALGLSAAAIRELGNGSALALNVGSVERLPVAEELFADGPHLASGVVEVGNANVGVEKARHFDIGLRQTAGEIRWSITGFITDFDDFIFLRDTGSDDAEHGFPVFEFTAQDADFSGVEAEFFAPIANVANGEIDLRIFGDYLRAKLGNGENVPRIPPLRYGARLAYHTDRIVVGVEATKHEEQDETAPFEDPTEGYTMLSADFDWALPTGGDTELNLFLHASNMLDEEARRHTSLVKDIAPLPARNFLLGLRAAF